MIDYHCHLLPGIDDGAVDMAEALEMARTLAICGFKEVYCTPHRITGFYDNRPEQVKIAVVKLQKTLIRYAIPLRVMPGMEYLLDRNLFAHFDDPLTLNTAGLTLVEAPFQSSADAVAEILSQLMERGIVPLIAHPERCSAFTSTNGELGVGVKSLFNLLRSKFTNFENPALRALNVDLSSGSPLVAFKVMGCRFQGNIGSFAGVYGEFVRGQAIRFLEAGIYNCLGSDAHSADRLEGILCRGMEVITQVVGKEIADSLLRSKSPESKTV